MFLNIICAQSQAFSHKSKTAFFDLVFLLLPVLANVCCRLSPLDGSIQQKK